MAYPQMVVGFLAESLNYETDVTYDYWGFAPPKTLDTDSGWKVMRVDKVANKVRFANGTTDYINPGTGFAALAYL